MGTNQHSARHGIRAQRMVAVIIINFGFVIIIKDLPKLSGPLSLSFPSSLVFPPRQVWVGTSLRFCSLAAPGVSSQGLVSSLRTGLY